MPKTIYTGIFSGFLLYLAGSAINADWNLAMWDIPWRVVAATFWLIIIGMVAAVEAGA